MPRFVIALRRAGGRHARGNGQDTATLIAALGGVPVEAGPSLEMAGELGLPARVVEADVGFATTATGGLPDDLIVEPEILHWPDGIPPMDFLPIPRGLPPGGIGQSIALRATGGGAPLAFARLHLHVRYRGVDGTISGTTDNQGFGRIDVPAGYRPAALVVIPAGGFWPMIARGERIHDVVDCPPLPTDGPLGWWHDKVGIDAFDPDAGAGVKVGVIDTGAGPHRALAHATSVGAFSNGVLQPPPAGDDVSAHGTHVAATLGGRSAGGGDYAGIAPGCELFIARVFRNERSGASPADIANAIDVLARVHRVDIINLSLGATAPSEVIHDAIITAAEMGTLCVCAAGNDGIGVQYPGAFPEAAAITAFGLAGWGPPGTLSAARLPEDKAMHGEDDLFAANFTCRGPEVVAAAPGVGIVAAVPSHHGEPSLEGAMDGTSMACPVASGCLAILLSQDGTYLAMPRQRARTEAARKLLRSMLRDVGLDQRFQGGGMPWIPKAAPAII